MNLATETAYGEPLDIGRLVRPLRWKLGLNAALVRILRGAAIILAGIAIVTALAHYMTLPGSNGQGGDGPWILIVSVSGAIATLGFAAKSRPSNMEAIRIADRNLGLKDRLTTAYEFSGDDSPMMALQRHELRTVIREQRMARAIALNLPVREVGMLLLAVALTIGSAHAPDPQATSAAARTHNHRVTAFAAASIKGLIAGQPKSATATPLHQSATRETPAVKILQDLAKKLQATDDQRTALKAIAAALAQMRQNASAAAQARAQLQAISKGLSGAATNALSGALRAGDSNASKLALQKLRKSIGTLSPAQRSALAQSLERAANAAAPSIKQTLRKAAFALGDNDPSTARQALTDLTKQIAAAQTSANSAPTSVKTAQQLAAIQQNVANGVSRSQAQPGAGKQSGAQRSSPGKTAPRNATASASGAGGKTASQSRPTGHGRAISGKAGVKQSIGSTVSGSSNTGKHGSAIAAISGTTRSGNGSGQGRSGSGRGTGSSGTGNAGARGHVGTVYLPGKRSSGPGITEDGPLGSSIAVTSPSFQSVVAQYTSVANSALDRIALPPALQGAVKRYFSALQK
jgi:ribosomal 50S subunit-associated protein YjgA (DUF615 family)